MELVNYAHSPVIPFLCLCCARSVANHALRDFTLYGLYGLTTHHDQIIFCTTAVILTQDYIVFYQVLLLSPMIYKNINCPLKWQHMSGKIWNTATVQEMFQLFFLRDTLCADAFTYYYQLHLSQYYLLRQIKFDIEVTQLSTNHNN